MSIKNTIWITWEVQRRNRELSKSFDIKLYEFAELHSRSGMKKYLKYIFGPLKTLKILWKEKPRNVICQNPSIVLSFMMVLIKMLTKISVIIDAHYGGVIPKKGKHKFLIWVANFIQRHATAVIVTNQEHKKYVENNGGVSIILQDKIPTIERHSPVPLKGIYNILLICSFADDEPYENVFKACRNISPEIMIYVTGNYKRKNVNPANLPNNTCLTGFVNDNDFVNLLNSVDGIMVLTTHENCLVCGAYESVSVEKPLLLSDTVALKTYFNKGAVYSKNDPESLAVAIEKLVANKEQLTKDVKKLKIELQEDWENRKQELLILIKS